MPLLPYLLGFVLLLSPLSAMAHEVPWEPGQAHGHSSNYAEYNHCKLAGWFDSSSAALTACTAEPGGTCSSANIGEAGCSLSGGTVGYYRFTGESYAYDNDSNHPDKISTGHSFYEIYVSGGGPTCPAGLLQVDPTSCQAPKVSLSLGKQCPQEGNPISLASGNKFEPDTDYSGTGPLPLIISRAYNSLDGSWRFSYSRSLELVDSTTIYAWLDDGRMIPFEHDGANWEPSSENRRNLVAVTGGYEMTQSDGTVEVYKTNGQLTSITNRAGQTLSVIYNSSGELEKVMHFTGRELMYVLDSEGRIVSITDPAGGSYRYSYSNLGLLLTATFPDDTPADSTDDPVKIYHYEDSSDLRFLTGVTDENGDRYSTFGYTHGRATSTEHAGGVDRFEVSFDPDSKVTVTNPLARDTTYTFEYFNGRGRVTNVDGQPAAVCGATSSSLTYDANGFVASRTDEEGNVTTYVRNSDGRETSRTEASGTPEARTITTTWHSTLGVPTQTVKPGQTVDMTYDAQGRLLTRTVSDTQTQSLPYVTTGNTRTVTYTYNSFGFVATIDGPRTDVSDITTFTYDANGQLISTTNALGHSTSVIARDAHGRPTLIRDANGLDTELVYSARGWLTSRTIKSAQGDASTVFDYDNAGQLTRLTLPTGLSISYEYDAAHRLLAIENDLGERVEYSLDNSGNRLAETVKGSDGAVARTAQQTFDELSRVVLMIDGVNNATQYDYDDNSNKTDLTDALIRNSSQEFDALNQLIKALDPDLGETNYSYDDRGNLTQVIDPRGVVTTYTYDGLDNLIEEVSADAGTRVYTYDSAGNMTQSLDARSVVANYTYDALNRLTAISYPSASAENVTYLYDTGSNATGRLSAITDESGSTSFSYDDRGNVVSDTRIIGGTTYATSFAYDLGDNQTSITYPSGRMVDRVLDAVGRAQSISHTVSSVTESLLDNVTYDAYGGASGLAYGNGTYLIADYDDAGRLEERRLLGSYSAAPIAYADAGSVQAQSSITLDLLANDHDLNGDTLSILSVTQSAGGSVSVNPDQTVTFTATGFANSIETFTYQATDGVSPSNAATVTITVSTNFLDADGDGLHDPYETAMGLDPTDGTDAVADADGDGVSNYDEFLAGTDPLANDLGYRSAVLSSTPDGFWSFDDSTQGTVVDAVAGRNISISGGTHTMGEPTLLENGASVAFDNAYGQAANSNSFYLNGDFTIEMLARWTNSSSSVLFEKFRWSSSLGYPGPIVYASSKLVFQESASAKVTSTARGLKDGRWRHLTFVRRGSRMEIWINGQLDAVNENAPAVTTTNNQHLRVMGYYNKTAGNMDELAVYQRALTPAEVVAHFQSQGDKDLDGMPNTWEMDVLLDPLVDDATGDPDGDGATNYDEFVASSDPMIHPNGYGAAVSADSPVGYWRMDDASTTAYDASGNGHAGTYNPSYTQLEAAPIGEGDAVSFNGGYIEVPHDAQLNVTGDYTIEGYLRWTGTTRGIAFGKWGSAAPYAGPLVYGNMLDEVQTAGHIQFREANSAGLRVSSTKSGLNDGNWRHYAFIRRGNSLEIWISGFLDNSITLSSVTAFVDSNPLYIMGWTGVQDLLGGADEIAFYDHALTPLDIEQRVLQGKQPSQASVQHQEHLLAKGGMLWVRDVRQPETTYGAYQLAAGGGLTPKPDFRGAYDGFATLDTQGLSLLLVSEGERGDFLYRRIPSGVSSGLVKTASGGLSETWTYTFDAVNNISGVTKPAGPESYGYDNLDRLDTFTLPGSSAVDYSYDLVGNRLSVSQSGVTSNLTYASSANRLINNAGVAISYDANGNPLTQGGEIYTYNARNRLVQVSDSSGVVASYSYNALGQRVNKLAGSADIDFVYDLNGLLLGEYANGLLIREYVHGPNGPVAQIESDGSVLTLHTDHLGTPRAATDANQSVIWRWEGKPFGETAAVEDPDGDMTDVTVNLRFPGQYFDMETGQHYNYFRTYDPSMGRYTQSDPIGLAGGPNRYAYAMQNPILHSDPTGLIVGALGKAGQKALDFCRKFPKCKKFVDEAVEQCKNLQCKKQTVPCDFVNILPWWM